MPHSNTAAPLRCSLFFASAAFAVCLPLPASADDVVQRNQALTVITPQLVRSHVQFLSHDLLEGRNTGERGYEIAREYVASQFVRMGAQPMPDGTHLQAFEVLVGTEDRGSKLTVGDTTVAAEDASFMPDWTASEPVIDGDGIYVGQGLVADARDDYGRIDVQDKVVFMIPGVPAEWKEHPTLALLERTKIQVALGLGARAVVMLQMGQDDQPERQRPMALTDGSTPSPRAVVTVGPQASARLMLEWGIDPAQAEAQALLGLPARPVGSTVISRARNISRIRSWNVVGIVPGSDPALQGEAVVFTAHLDHVGVGEADEEGDRIYNGTHDNALGVGKMLAAAEAMASAPARRTTVFVAVGAEERGLLGSWHYVKHPVIPLEDTVAALNHDGGLDGAATSDFFAFGLEFTTLDKALDLAAADTDMILSRDYRPPFGASQALLFRSDQYAFLAAGVPGAYLMDGFTIDGDPERGRLLWNNYLNRVNHQQRDNYDPTWSFESPARMATLSVRAAWQLGDADERPSMRPNAWFPTTRGIPIRPE